MDSVAAVGRTCVSLAAVLGLLWLVSRWLHRKKITGGPGAGEVAVLSRQSLGHKAALAVVRVGQRAVVVGVTEQQVSLLAEVPLADVVPAPVEDRQVVDLPLEGLLAGAGPDGGAAAARPPATTPGSSPAGLEPAFKESPDRAENSTDAGEAPAGRSAALAGSALSPVTWAKAVDVLRERTTRR